MATLESGNNNSIQTLENPLTNNNSFSDRISFGNSVLVFIGLICALSLFLNNGIYLCVCLVTFILIIRLLWRQNRPGILVFAFTMQWVQVLAFVIWINVMEKDLDNYYPGGGIAIVLSCIGLLIIAIVINVCIRNLKVPDFQYLRQEAEKFNRRKLLIVYIVSTLFLTSIGLVLGITSGAAQILITVSSFKWVFFCLYGFSVWLGGDKRNKLIFFIILIYEFSASLNSYFSSFKEVFLFTLILILTFVKSVKLKQIIYGLLIVCFLGSLILTWSAIKGEYRRFLNKGQRGQVVAVERSQALDKMQSQIEDLSWKRYQMALFITLYRVQYLQHFAIVIERIPNIIPYQNGSVWWDNISFVITPRFLFPDKGVYSASEKTNKFTGKKYAGLKEGSAFSLGYFVDGFVDFGYIGMFVPLIFIGLFLAAIYRTFYRMWGLNFLLRLALINVCLYPFTSFEADGLFLFGRLLTTFLVFWFFAKTVLPTLQKWLYKES